jgi:hypothetical protein
MNVDATNSALKIFENHRSIWEKQQWHSAINWQERDDVSRGT